MRRSFRLGLASRAGCVRTASTRLQSRRRPATARSRSFGAWWFPSLWTAARALNDRRLNCTRGFAAATVRAHPRPRFHRAAPGQRTTRFPPAEALLPPALQFTVTGHEPRVVREPIVQVQLTLPAPRAVSGPSPAALEGPDL